MYYFSFLFIMCFSQVAAMLLYGDKNRMNEILNKVKQKSLIFNIGKRASLCSKTMNIHLSIHEIAFFFFKLVRESYWHMVGKLCELLPCSWGPHSRPRSWRALSFPSSLFITCFHSTEEPWNNCTIQRKHCWPCWWVVSAPSAPPDGTDGGFSGPKVMHSLLQIRRQVTGQPHFLRILLFSFIFNSQKKKKDVENYCLSFSIRFQ